MKISKYKFVIGALIFTIRAYSGFILLVPALYMSAIMRDFAISPGEAGFLVASTMVACLVFVLLTGLITEKIGSKQTATIAVALATFGTFLVGLAPNYGVALLGRFLLGTGITWFIPATMPSIMAYFSSREYGTVTAILGQSISIGLAMHFFLTARLFPPPNWREPHLVYAIIGVILTVLWALLGRGPKEELKREVPYLIRLKTRIPEVLKIKEVWLMGIFMFAAMGSGTVFSSWLPEFCEMERGLPVVLTAMAIGLYNLTNIVSGAIGGYLSDRVGLRRPFIILSGFLAFLFYMSAISAQNLLWLYASVIGMAWFAAMATFAISTIPMEVPEMTYESLPFAMSITLFFGFLGQVVMVPLVGYLSPLISFYYAMIINGVLYLLISISGLLCRETGWKTAK